jgi:hypothetical protein
MTGKKDGNNPNKPSAPYSTGTLPKHGNRPPGVDFEGEWSEFTFVSVVYLDSISSISDRKRGIRCELGN